MNQPLKSLPSYEETVRRLVRTQARTLATTNIRGPTSSPSPNSSVPASAHFSLYLSPEMPSLTDYNYAADIRTTDPTPLLKSLCSTFRKHRLAPYFVFHQDSQPAHLPDRLLRRGFHVAEEEDAIMALPSSHLKGLTRRRPLPPQLALTRATMTDLDDCFYVVHSAQGYADDVRDLRRFLSLLLSHSSSHLLVLGRVEDTPVSLIVLYSPKPSKKAMASSTLLTKPKDILLKHMWTHGAWQRRGYAPASLIHAFSLIPGFLEDQMQPEDPKPLNHEPTLTSQASKRHSYPFASSVRRPGSTAINVITPTPSTRPSHTRTSSSTSPFPPPPPPPHHHHHHHSLPSRSCVSPFSNSSVSSASTTSPSPSPSPGPSIQGSSRPWVVWAEVWQSHVASLCLELGFLHLGERTVWRCWKADGPRHAEVETSGTSTTPISTSPPPPSPKPSPVEQHRRRSSHASLQNSVQPGRLSLGATLPSPTASSSSSS
ncbi:MAG: hypothetical protein DHS80DRAFT_31195 [Piptocephalis tieghemiana]|nr:MAG: hypothetical protein DHS80DRAFT_31195 [Piptocephalis tieghemiana]